MISFTTIILFFVYFLGLGYSATVWLKRPENRWERLVLYLGMGVAVFPILAIILNALRLPLDWKLFLALSLILPAWHFLRWLKTKQYRELKIPSLKSLKLQPATLYLIGALAITALSLYLYASGAFAYPYLEDEDPWGHAVGIKYVALEKDAYDPFTAPNNVDPILSYIDPYPPAYDLLLGILHQTSPDLLWTMKFFNALLISVGFLFFYLFAKEFLRSQKKALFATFVLAVIPSYLSHFIWALVLPLIIFFPVMYALERSRQEKNWWILAALGIASIWVSQNISQPLTLTVMLLIALVVGSIASKQFHKVGFLAVIVGGLLSLSWWGLVILRKGLHPFLGYYLGGTAAVTEAAASTAPGQSLLGKIGGALFASVGSGSRAYTFSDFFFAQTTNMINNPIGIGWVLCLLVLFAVILLIWKYRARLAQHRWECIALFWLIFTFWGVNGATFPISVARGSFRVWMFLAIPLALLAAEGLSLLRQKFPSPLAKQSILIVVLIGILLTSAYPKYVHNTSPYWPTSGSFSGGGQEAAIYAQWFETLPLDTKVFLYAPRDKLALGFGMMSCAWCPSILDFRKTILEQPASTVHQFLKREGYQYLLISPSMEKKYFSKEFGEEKTAVLLPQRYNEIQSYPGFKGIAQTPAFVVFEVI